MGVDKSNSPLQYSIIINIPLTSNAIVAKVGCFSNKKRSKYLHHPSEETKSVTTNELTIVRKRPLPPLALIAMGPTDAVRAIVEHRTSVVDLASAINKLPENEAGGFLMPLPPILRAKIIRTAAGGADEEVPLLAVLEPEVAAQTAAVDAFLFRRISESDILAAIRDLDGETVEPTIDDRTVMIKMAGGKEIRIAIAMDPEVALSYLRTIAYHEDEGWQNKTLDLLGVEFLAFIISARHSGLLEIEEGEWMDITDRLDPWLCDGAREMARLHGFDPMVFERDLIGVHTETLHTLFTLPTDTVAEVRGTAKELAEDLAD